MSRVKLKKTALSHVTVTEEMALSHATSDFKAHVACQI